MTNEVFMDIVKQIIPDSDKKEEYMEKVRRDIDRFEEMSKQTYDKGDPIDISGIFVYSVAVLMAKGKTFQEITNIAFKVYYVMDRYDENDVSNTLKDIVTILAMKGVKLKKITEIVLNAYNEAK